VERTGVPVPPATWRLSMVGVGAGVISGGGASEARVNEWRAARAATSRSCDENITEDEENSEEKKKRRNKGAGENKLQFEGCGVGNAVL
jgi:hypothetical protein